MIARCVDRQEKLDCAHDDDEEAHRHAHGQRKHPDAPLGQQHRVRQQNSVDRSGSSNGRNRRDSVPARIERRPDDQVGEACPNSAKEKIHIEFARAPHVLERGAEHGEVEKVEQDVPDSFVEKEIREELPDKSEVDDIGGHHPKPIGEESLAGGSPDQLRAFLDEEHGNANDAECFDGAGEIFAEVEAVAVAAGKGAHELESKGLP